MSDEFLELTASLPQSLVEGMQGWQKQIPMWVTWFRIWLTPVILFLIWDDATLSSWLAAALFIVASISDYYDGYFARKYNAHSDMGRVMDPIADKILVTSVLVLMVPLGKVDPWMVIVLLARDTFISGIRALAASQKRIISANPTGKWKTALQMVAIPALIVDTSLGAIHLGAIGYYALWVAVILSLTSGAQYYWGFRKSQAA